MERKRERLGTRRAAGTAGVVFAVLMGTAIVLMRIDLPGGDDDLMVTSLARLLHEIPPDTRVLPGHGVETTMAAEARTSVGTMVSAR